MSAPQYYRIKENGREAGPFTLDQLQYMLSVQSISFDTLCTSDGWKRWLPVSAIAVCGPGDSENNTSSDEAPRYRVARWSSVSVVLMTLGIVGLIFGGLGIFAIVASLFLPNDFKFYCGNFKREIDMNSNSCPHCACHLGLTTDIKTAKFNRMARIPMRLRAKAVFRWYFRFYSAGHFSYN